VIQAGPMLGELLAERSAELRAGGWGAPLSPTADSYLFYVAGEDHVSIGTDGGVSAEVMDDAFRRNFAEVTRVRVEAGIAAPGETADGYLFASDLNTARRLETLATLLAGRGHSDARIEKILGRNLRRVFADAWGS